MTYLVRVDLAANPSACFGVVVADGVVTAAAPITRWAIGRLGRDIVAYWRRRGATVTWQEVSG